MKRVTGKLRLVVIGATFLVFVYLLLFSPLPYFRSWWASEIDPGFLKLRHRVADGLLVFRRLNGKMRNEVVGLLGEPLETEYFSRFDMVYKLGAERGFMSIDSEWLVLKLDSSGKVIESRIVAD